MVDLQADGCLYVMDEKMKNEPGNLSDTVGGLSRIGGQVGGINACLLYDSRVMNSRHFLSTVSGESDSRGMSDEESIGAEKLPARRSICAM